MNKTIDNKIRILYLIDSLGIGGSQSDLLRVCRHIDKTCFDLNVWALHQQNNLMHEQFIQAGANINYIAKHKYSPFLLINLIRNLKKHKFDIIHTRVNVSALFGSVSNSIARHLPLVIGIDAFPPIIPLWQFWLCYSFSSRWANIILHGTQNVVDELIKLKIPQEKIWMIPPAFPALPVKFSSREQENFRVSWGIKADDIVILSVCRLHPNHEEVKLFLQAFASVTNQFPNAKLIYVGDGPLENQLQQSVRHLGLENQVIFAGYQLTPSLFYSTSDIYLATSFNRVYCGIAIAEAMLYGLPILAYEIGNKVVDSEDPELVVNDSSAFLKACSLTAFIQALEDLLDDKSKRHSLGQLAQEKIHQHISPQERAKKHEELYLHLLKSNKS